MSETTQILFNSPALHSLKRDQLIKLCKIHSIKATGKNIDLIQKLKEHASTLPLSDPLSVATRSEQSRDVDNVQDDRSSILSRLDSQRPSEQWEVVMEDIPELPETSRGTLSSLRSVTGNAPDEFGTGGGSKSSSVTSSLRAIANTFNFKRATPSKPDDDGTTSTSNPIQPNTTDELASHSVPYSSIPESLPSDMPQTDHFKFSTPDTTLEDHIPGQLGNPAIPAQANALVGVAAGPTKTTIRLVSSTPIPTLSPEPGTPHLRPVDPGPRVPVWPLSPQPAPSERLYPALPEKSTKPGGVSSATRSKMYPTPANDVQDLFSPAPKPQKERVGIPRSEPFLFGSPLPRHSVSNKAFDTAAASVLEEMNKRLSAAGVQKVGTDVFGGSAIAAAPNSGTLRVQDKVDRFDKVHEEQFNKMDSIASHYAAKRGAPGSKKRKSDVLGHESAPATKRSSADTRRMGIPGGFDEEEEVVDDVQEEEDRRMSKRVRTAEEEKQAERERAATRKMLEARKDKRRSSRHGRTSVAGPQAASNKGKATPRCGFFSSAKSIVRSVWNFGAGSPAKASRVSTATAATKSKTAGRAGEPKETKPVLPPKKPSLTASRPSEGPASRKSIAPTRSGSTTNKAPKPTGETVKSWATHSRAPSLSSNTGAKTLNPAPAASTSSRQSVRGVSRSSTLSLRGVAPASMGNGTTKPPSVLDADESTAEGSGSKTSVFSPSSRTTATTSSRLFAPTASSLAKTRGTSAAAAPVTSTVVRSKTGSIVAQRAKTPPRNVVLDAITNSPRGKNADSPGAQGKIFTTPLLRKQVIPPPVRPTSLTAAAATLAATAAASTTTAVAAAAASGLQSPERWRPAAAASGGQLPARKPRISRSRIIAKLGAQRAAAATSPSSTAAAATLPSHSATTGAAGAAASLKSKIPRASGSAVRTPRVRSSMGTATRRSYAGTKSASRGSDVLMSAKKHARQSEYVRRRSRAAGSAAGTARGLGGSSRAAAAGPGLDGSMAMDIDDD
ncbi:hypothetical protein BJV78DRAFT_1257097 [Lactifluus subvellereus]|nr:hypothetical protein BJV78DRAFT_1257097 [Lactifluus subvellereus]